MIRRLICRYVGHLPRRFKVTQVDIDLDTGRQVAHLVMIGECLRCLERLL